VSEKACLQLEIGSKTDVGRVRENNEDTCRALPSLNLFIISDGMGGQTHGELASAIAADTITVYCSDRRSQRRNQNSLRRRQHARHQRPRRQRLPDAPISRRLVVKRCHLVDFGRNSEISNGCACDSPLRGARSQLPQRGCTCTGSGKSTTPWISSPIIRVWPCSA
jgi:hypothetical protein